MKIIDLFLALSKKQGKLEMARKSFD